jgi:hypothetical protein
MSTATKQRQLADFLHQNIRFPRVVSPFGLWGSAYLGYPGSSYPLQRPTTEQLANDLLSVAEFRSLQLGTWLSTTDGQILTKAVEMVAPPFYRQDVELLVDALKLAASMQQRESQQVAGKIALGAVVVGVVIAGVVAMSSSEPGGSA